ncbi:MAG: bifunctional glutamate N-acetyltransferase/amino-acid acetyltransferase ArgJ [Candidatus Omnitrophota bacterium]
MKTYRRAILPKGFQANGLACGIKKSGKPDLALFCSTLPAKASCKFTSNKIQAAPIQVSKFHLKDNNLFRAVIVNSGNANCFCGRQGLKDALHVAGSLARSLGIRKNEVLMASTGIIGKRLPVKKIEQALPKLISGLSLQGVDKAQRAILTTDTFSKTLTVQVSIGGRGVTICGIAKGAGMIAPDMATMLAFLFTDAHILKGALHRALGICVEETFNCITVDGCMSTNDSVMMLANGSAGNALIETGKDFYLFVRALKVACLELAKMIVRDAEGASKFIQIRVDEARNFQEAKKFALAIANSNLFKTAVFGQNPNFGRIVAALGSCGVELKEEGLKVHVSPLERKEIFVRVSVNRGESSAIVHTSDLTPEYIRINAAYN